jgi:tetratricopeptide (TPR) repeat protein
MKAVMSIISGNLEIARELLDQSLALFQEIDHKHGASEALFELAWVATQQGQIDAVKHYYEKSVELKRQIGDQYGLANELYTRAVQEAFHWGNLEKAKEFFWESSDLFQDLGDPISNARSLRIMDDLYIINGWFEVALVTRQKTMQLFQNLGDIAGIGLQHTQLGEAYYHLGDYENAEREGRQSLEVLQDRDYPFEQAFSRWQLGMTLLAQQRYDEARQLLLECINLSSEGSRRDGVGSAYAGMARAEFALRSYDQAWEYALSAIEILLEYRHLFWMFYALATLALLLGHQGQDEQAIEVYSLLSRYDFVANSKWFEDVFGNEIEGITANLAPDNVQAAQERAQSLDVWETAQKLLDSHQNLKS